MRGRSAWPLIGHAADLMKGHELRSATAAIVLRYTHHLRPRDHVSTSSAYRDAFDQAAFRFWSSSVSTALTPQSAMCRS